ncbi:MAG: hypothetical protein ACLUD9_00775 [Anaerotignum faecicola]
MKETPMQEEFDMEKDLQQEFIQELAEFFKIFGDATVSAFCRPCWRGSEMWGIWQTYWK